MYMEEINLKEFSNLKEILSKTHYIISDEKIEKIIEMIKKTNPRQLISSKNILIKQSSGRSFLVLSDFIVVKCFTLKENYLADLRPILKLNQIGFKHIVNLIDYNSDYNLLGIERLKIIYKGSKLLKDYNNLRFIKDLIIVILSSIFNLYVYNSQINKDFSISNVGIDINGIIKVFDFELCCYINKENKFQSRIELFQSFKSFMDELIQSTDTISIKKELTLFMDDFEYKLTDLNIYENPTYEGKYKKTKIRSFKFLDFNSIVGYASQWKKIDG